MKINGVPMAFLLLKGVTRWGMTTSVLSESVSSHSCEVAMFSWALANRLQCVGRLPVGVSVGDVVIAAIFHDFHEVITGDTPTPVKAIIGRDALAKAESRANEVLLGSANSWIKDALKDALSPQPSVKAIVKVADTLVAYAFAAREVALGNREMRPALARLRQSFFSNPMAEDMCAALNVVISNVAHSDDWLVADVDELLGKLLES